MIAVLILIQGCAFGITKRLGNGYDFGDIYGGLVEDVATYCTDASAAARSVARHTIKATTGLPIPNLLCPVYEQYRLEPM